MSTKDGDGPGTSQESAAGPAAGSAGDPSTVAAAGDASNLGRRLPTQQVDGEPELATTAALLRRAFTETHKYEPGYLKWFYIDNPEGQVVAFDHDDDGTLARGRLEQQGDRLVQLGRAGSADGAGSEPPSGVSSVSAARAGPAASRANSSPSAPTTARSTDVIGACGAETSPR